MRWRLTRRRVLASAAAFLGAPNIPRLPLAALTATTAVAAAQSADAPDTTLVPFVDVHCHVFNGADLPIADYLSKGAIREKVGPSGVGDFLPFFTGFKNPEVALRKDLLFLDELVKSQSVSADAELATLRDGVKRYDHDERSVFRTILLALRDVDVPGTIVNPVPSLGKPTRGFALGALSLFAGSVLKGTDVYKLMDAFLKVRHTDKAAVRSAADALVKHVFPDKSYVEKDEIERQAKHYAATAVDFTRPREALIEKLADLGPTKSDRRLRILTPSINDFEYWLRKPNTDSPRITEIPQQVRVLSALSKKQPASRIVHGFVPFDPLREVLDGTSLEWVREAIETYGFLGVKVYPPMGFQPIGNAALARQRSRYRWENRFKFGEMADARFRDAGIDDPVAQGAALDEALLSLYDYCNRNHVPIMAHSSRTQGTFGWGEFGELTDPQWYAASRRANPAYWGVVLQEFPTLRLNLGHAGGIWCLGAKRKPTVTDGVFKEDERDRAFAGVCELEARPLRGIDIHARWPLEMFRLMSETTDNGQPRFPNVYADFSDWTDPSEVEDASRYIKLEQNPKKLKPVQERLDKLGPQVDRAFTFLSQFLDEAAQTEPTKTFRPDIIRKRLMYGTDWIVMGHSHGAESFYAAMNARLSALFAKYDEFKNDFFGGNAVRYLGLAKEPLPQPTGQRRTIAKLPQAYARLKAGPITLLEDSSTPRKRLAKFYQAHGLDAKRAVVFAAFDAVV